MAFWAVRPATVAKPDVALTLQAYGIDNHQIDLARWLAEARTGMEADGWAFTVAVETPTELIYAASKQNRRFDVRVVALCAGQNDYAVLTALRAIHDSRPRDVPSGSVPRFLSSLRITGPSPSCG